MAMEVAPSCFSAWWMAAAAVITVIENYTVRDSGKFFTYTGKPMPW